ncbi:MAG TPA: hypothetical protein VIR03_00320 [Candidatus Saccharimonadales bacterium]
MKLQVVNPLDAQGKERNVSAEQAILLPSIMGGSLWQPGSEEGTSVPSDLLQRAQGLASATGKVVFALQRLSRQDVDDRRRILGRPVPFSPAEYTDLVGRYGQAVTEAMLNAGTKRLSVVAASAGGLVALKLLSQRSLPAGSVESLHVYDSTAMRAAAAPVAFARWGWDMVAREARRPEAQRNHSPLPYEVESETGPLMDMWLHRRVWTTDESYRIAEELACDPASPNTHIYVPKRNFTIGSVKRTNRSVWRLRAIAGANGNQGFAADIVPTLHSLTDDHEALGHMHNGTLADWAQWIVTPH